MACKLPPSAAPAANVWPKNSRRFMIVWRASLPLRKNMFEVAQVVAGRMPRGWYRARELGKTYYPSLKKFVDARRAERQEVSAPSLSS